MTALSKFLVLLAIFLLASLGDAFLNHARLDHLIRFVEPMSKPTNKPTVEPAKQTTSKRGKYSLSEKQDAELPSKITSNTSYPFEAVHGVSHVHVKYIVTGQVTIRDGRDNEIQSMCPDLSLPQPSNWQGSKQRSSKHACLVLFSSFCAIGAGLKCGVHPHQVLATSSSTRGLCHGKKSEQAECIAFAQMHGLCHDKKSEQAGCIASAQIQMPYSLAAYQTNPTTPSCASTFQLVVASLVWLSNATSACARHSSSNKSSCTSGFNCQFIVESVFEGAQACDVAPASISRHRRHRHIQRSALIVVSVDSKTSFHLCKDFRIFCEGKWERKVTINTINMNDLHNGFVGSIGLGLSSFVALIKCISLVSFVSDISGFGFLLGVISHVNGFSLDGLKHIDRVSHHISLAGHITDMGLVGFIGLGISFIGLGVGYTGLVNLIKLVELIGFIGLNFLVGQISLFGLIGLIGFVDLVGLVGIVGLGGIIGIGGFGGLSLVG
jgi:hypothetical protein